MKAGANHPSIKTAKKRNPPPPTHKPCSGSQTKYGWMVDLSCLTCGFLCRDSDLVHLGGAHRATINRHYRGSAGKQELRCRDFTMVAGESLDKEFICHTLDVREASERH